MERNSDPKHTAPVYGDILDRMERLIELAEAAQSPNWKVMYTSASDDVLDSEGWHDLVRGWEPFAVTAPSPGVTFIWWRTRC